MGDREHRRASGERAISVAAVALLVALSATVIATPVGAGDGGGAPAVAGRTSSANGSGLDSCAREIPTVRQSAIFRQSTIFRQSAGNQSSGNQSADNQSVPEFDATVFRDVAGQVATEDGTVAVRGTATGTERVLVVLFGRRGRVVTDLVSVDDRNVFEEDDLELVTADGRPISEGLVVATVLSPGRDGRVGDGEVAGVTGADLSTLATLVRNQSGQRFGDGAVGRTQRQLVELFYDQTVEDAGSDDLLLAEEFVYTDGRTTVERVVPRSAVDRTGNDTEDRAVEPVRVGDEVVVRGLTNRRPGDNTILVEVVGGPSAEAFDLAATDSWDTDGVWQVELDATGVEPGVYAVEADDGDSSDTVRIRVLPAGAGSSGNATESQHPANASREPVRARTDLVAPFDHREATIRAKTRRNGGLSAVWIRLPALGTDYGTERRSDTEQSGDNRI